MNQEKTEKCKNDDNSKQNLLNVNLNKKKIFNIQKVKIGKTILDENNKFDISFFQNFQYKKEAKKDIFEKIITKNFDLPNDINIMDEITKLNNIYQIINKVNNNINSINEKLKKKIDDNSILKKEKINKNELFNKEKIVKNNNINNNNLNIGPINNQENLFFPQNNFGNINNNLLVQKNLNSFIQSCNNNTNFINLLNCNMIPNENIFKCNNINNINSSMNYFFGINYQLYNSNINNFVNTYNQQYYIPMNNTLLENYSLHPNFFYNN